MTHISTHSVLLFRSRGVYLLYFPLVFILLLLLLLFPSLCSFIYNIQVWLSHFHRTQRYINTYIVFINRTSHFHYTLQAQRAILAVLVIVLVHLLDTVTVFVVIQ